MSLKLKRACDLLVGDRVSLPTSMLPPEAIIEKIVPLKTFQGKIIYQCQLKTLGDVPFFIDAALFPNERIQYVRVRRNWFKTLNDWLNPFVWFSIPS